jgi:thiamine biosynthesis lipoprotein
MSDRHRSVLLVVLLTGIVALLVVGHWQTAKTQPMRVPFPRRIEGLMSTTGQLQVVLRPDQEQRARRALDDAVNAIARVEALMSAYIDASEIGRLNAAGADETIALSAETREVLRSAKEFHVHTGGAFDVTIRPLIALWIRASKDGRVPDADALTAARAQSNWGHVHLTSGGAYKSLATAKVDLGGIAKGYAIDRAAQAMRDAGVDDGLVELGGDVYCFGRRPGPERSKWRAAVRDPFEPSRLMAHLTLSNQAVCTSGNYERYSMIGGKRYSHILDPTTGRPVGFAASVTVVAPTATDADAWATALSVLGPDGMALLEAHKGVEALMIIGQPENCRALQTPGFAELLAGPLDMPTEVVTSALGRAPAARAKRPAAVAAARR